MVQWISPLLTNTTFIRMDAARRPQLWCSCQTGSVHDNDTCTMQTRIEVSQILQTIMIYHIFVKSDNYGRLEIDMPFLCKTSAL